MNAFLVALLLSVGVGTWIYIQLQRRVGHGNSKTALKGALLAAVIAFVVVLTVGLSLHL